MWQMMEVRASNDLAIIKSWYLIGYFLKKTTKKQSKYVHCCGCYRDSSTVQRRAWCGFCCDMDHCCDLKKIYNSEMTLLVAIKMLITGTLGHCREHTNLCIFFFFLSLLCTLNEYWGEKSATWQQCFCFCIYFCSATRFPKSRTVVSFAARGDLTPTPPFRLQRSIVGSCCHLRPGPGRACVLLTPDTQVDPTLPAGFFEREGDLPQQGWRGNVGMSRWMEWWMVGHVTPTLDDHVSVNVITAIITA